LASRNGRGSVRKWPRSQQFRLKDVVYHKMPITYNGDTISKRDGIQHGPVGYHGESH
jgi:hypothetical protein